MSCFMNDFEHLEIELEEIKSARDNFDDNKVIGIGGFGKVYEGKLSRFDGRNMVAFKRLDRTYGQGGPEFFKEIRMLSCYRHENLISLLGFCNQGDEMILVYEHACRGSLDRILNDTTLTWTQRLRICLDAAKGISFLHDPNGEQQRVLHCDIKSANILLDENLNAKVADFGLSKICPANQQYTVLVTSPLGTPGYCDPLFMDTYQLTKESDVYSFGVVLFEVLCGRLCFEYSSGSKFMVFVPIWKKSYKQKKLHEIIFPDLMQQMEPSSLEIFVDIAYQCLQKSRAQRPTMSVVVEKLKIALQFQELLFNFKPSEYEEILKAADPPLIYRSNMELKAILTNGFRVNGGKTLLLINDKGENCERIYIESCSNLDTIMECNLVYPSHYNNSRFPRGRCYTYKKEFKARFTSDHKTVDLELDFEDIGYTYKLEVAGFEFQPLEEKAAYYQVLEYQDIIKSASQSLFYKFVEELKMLLSIGVHRDGYNTWFSLNENGENCEMISIADCLLPNENYTCQYEPRYYSRFPGGIYQTNKKGFKTHVTTQFLSPFIRYTVKLVLMDIYSNLKQKYVNLKYKLEGETRTSTVYLANKSHDDCYFLANRRHDDCYYVAEFYQFTSDGRIIDLEIEFFDDQNYMEVEGILFQPFDKVEHDQVVEDEIVDMQTISDSDIVKLLNDSVQWQLKEDLYSSFLKWFNIDKGQEWYSVDKNGKKCLMFSARGIIRSQDLSFQSLPESRFQELAVIKTYSYVFEIVKEIKSDEVSPDTTYAVYLVYRLPEDPSSLESPLETVDCKAYLYDHWYIYLVGPPDTPTIGQKIDQNTHNPLNRPKLNSVPQQRSDGWMEVKVCPFKAERTSMHLKVQHCERKDLGGLIIQGIELRPI